jgi:hypothetical protein
MPVYQLGNCNDYFNSQYQPDWTDDSAVFGVNGDDTIALDVGNSVASSGNGRDALISLGGGMQPGNTLTGGLDRDTFILECGTDNLVITNDAAGDGVMSDEDTFKGPIDVITDHQHGEHLGLRQYDSATNGPAAADVPVARVDSVTLAPGSYAGVTSARPSAAASQTVKLPRWRRAAS